MLLRSRKPVLLLFIAILCVSSVAQTPAPTHRPTSTPYTGDLSIFDGKSRAVANQQRNGHARHCSGQECG